MILALKRAALPALPALPSLPAGKRPWRAALKRLHTLETSRLRLTPLEPQDADLLFPIMNDPQVVAHWDCETQDEPDKAAEMVDGQVLEMACGRGFYWAVRSLEDGRFLGVCELAELDRTARSAEVGFIFAAEAADLAQEALEAVIGCAGGLALKRINGRTCLGDRRAEALLQRLGFKQCGLLRGPTIDDERRDRRLFVLTL
ncbi:MAG TPA: GNAT family N-acetyltransferase [Phenylobacterium sp.]